VKCGWVLVLGASAGGIGGQWDAVEGASVWLELPDFRQPAWRERSDVVAEHDGSAFQPSQPKEVAVARLYWQDLLRGFAETYAYGR
jgi:hypothetical protein